MPATFALCACLTILVLTALVINTCGAPITCEAGTYVVGKPASITCNFRTNVSASGKSFGMSRYSTDTTKGDIGTDVLICHWSDDTKKYDCDVSDGYTFNNVITDRVAVGITNATDDYKGLYMCFFVPGDEADKHACEFSVEVQTLSRDDATVPNIPQKKDDKAKEIGIAVGAVVLVIVICCVVGFLYRKHRNKKSGDIAKKRLIPLKNTQVKERLKPLELFNRLNQVMGVVQPAIHSALDRAAQQAGKSTPPDAALNVYRIPCPRLVEEDTGDYLVVDFCSRHFKISDIRLRTYGILKIPSKCYPVTPEIRTGDQLFKFLIESMDNFARDKLPDAEKRNATLVVPFPCQQTCLDNATLVKWTQEFSCEGVTNTDIRHLLQQALKAKSIGEKPCKVKFVAIVNDVVSTVVSVAHQNPDCRIGLVVGSGLNACYVQSWGHVPNENSQEEDNIAIYNTEVGALGDTTYPEETGALEETGSHQDPGALEETGFLEENAAPERKGFLEENAAPERKGCLEEFRTKYDRELDQSSTAPRNQTLEKMVSWTYIGELVRLVLKDLRTDGLLLGSVPLTCELFLKGYLRADHVAQIDSEPNAKRNSGVTGNTGAENHFGAGETIEVENPQSPTERILRELGADQYTEEDLNTVRHVCEIVIDRAAHLVGTVLASLINRLDQPGVLIVVDGELFRKIPRFHDLLYTTAKELVNAKLKDKFYLVSSFGRRNVGAARIAAAAVSQ